MAHSTQLFTILKEPCVCKTSLPIKRKNIKSEDQHSFQTFPNLNP